MGVWEWGSVGGGGERQITAEAMAWKKKKRNSPVDDNARRLFFFFFLTEASTFSIHLATYSIKKHAVGAAEEEMDH